VNPGAGGAGGRAGGAQSGRLAAETPLSLKLPVAFFKELCGGIVSGSCVTPAADCGVGVYSHCLAGFNSPSSVISRGGQGHGSSGAQPSLTDPTL
jgi:hypothetical protein